MSHSHFAIRINDQPSTYLRGTEQEMLDKVTTLLQQMDGVDTWCLSIWRVPKDRSDEDVPPTRNSYIQCAGSAEALAVEVRVEGDDHDRQYAVGKPMTSPSDKEAVEISYTPVTAWRRSIWVARHEVYTATEAADIFAAYLKTDKVPASALLRELHLTSTEPPINDRVLVYRDSVGNEVTWKPGDPETAYETFGQFFKGISRDNPRFVIEDEAAGEELILMVDRRAVCRVKHGSPTQSEYALIFNADNYLDRARVFIKKNGYDALDTLGPWLPDEKSLERTLIQDVFIDTTLASTHPTELRSRLAILSCINGTPPVVQDGVTYYHYDSPRGGSVSAWFKANGHGLLTMFWPDSELNQKGNPNVHKQFYDGVPDDLRILAKETPASGVFLYSTPCELSPGIIDYMQARGIDIDQANAFELLERFLEIKHFTPRALKRLKVWWGDAAIDAGFKAAQAYEATLQRPQRKRIDLNGFLFYWDGFGGYDKKKLHYVFTHRLQDGTRAALLVLIKALGLELLDAPTGSPKGQLWVRTDAEIDGEINNWSSIGVRQGTRLRKSFDRAGLAEKWPQWCKDGVRWDRKAKYNYDEDDLKLDDGTFQTLLTEDFMNAYQAAGAEVTDYTYVFQEIDRTFSVIVSEGATKAVLEVRLGRTNNAQDFFAIVVHNTTMMTHPESLAELTYAILRDRGELQKVGGVAPRPIVGSRSQLEVTAREIVAMMRKVARDWDARITRAASK